MRIIAGTQRGRILTAPKGTTTRPTTQRTRQAVFDMLMHAPWYGHAALKEAHVLDAFAGTGALGLEALSRGARSASFIEQNRTSLEAIHTNIRVCRMEAQTRVLHSDVTRPPRAKIPHTLIFLDPPYHKYLVEKALRSLYNMGWIAENALVVAETEDDATENQPEGFQPVHAHLLPNPSLQPPAILAQRRFNMARISIWRHVTGFPS